MKRLYIALVARLLRALCSYCLRRGRYVDYVHRGQLYLRRYAVAGHLTGDVQGWRAWLPNLYVHQIINPDLDPCLHDHPWPWGVSWIALGSYEEQRFSSFFDQALSHLPGGYGSSLRRTLTAPALNILRGSTFHRIAEIEPGTWTIFLAGPRAHAKPWGYLVPGRGYVHHSERHEEFGGEEVRGKPCKI